MTDEVVDLPKLLEHLNIDEEQVLRLAQSFKSLNIDQRREIEGDLFRNCPSHLHTQLWKILDLAVHISRCRTPRCQYQNCGKAKGIFRHAILCKTRFAGGCRVCKKMWFILILHNLACKESNCNVPRCRDLKEHPLLSDPNLAANINFVNINFMETPEIDLKEYKEYLLHSDSQLADSINFKGTPKQLRYLLNLVEHTSQCRSPHCLYPKCGVLKKVFHHSNLCKTQADGGCNECMQMWSLLKIHAQACKESICNAPRCRDLKEYLLRSDSR